MRYGTKFSKVGRHNQRDPVPDLPIRDNQRYQVPDFQNQGGIIKGIRYVATRFAKRDNLRDPVPGRQSKRQSKKSSTRYSKPETSNRSNAFHKIRDIMKEIRY